MLLVHNLQTQVRRHHENDQTQTQGGKEDDAEALARVEGYRWLGRPFRGNKSEQERRQRTGPFRQARNRNCSPRACPVACCRNVQPQVVAQMSSSRRT